MTVNKISVKRKILRDFREKGTVFQREKKKEGKIRRGQILKDGGKRKGESLEDKHTGREGKD